MIQPFQVDFLLVVINTGYQAGSVDVYPDLEVGKERIEIIIVPGRDRRNFMMVWM